MEFYQIKKLLKNVVTEPQKTNTRTATIGQVKSLEMSHEDGIHNEDPSLPGIHSPKSKDSPSKRHDRAFTLSWASKQDDKRKDYFISSNNESPKIVSPTTNSPLTKKNRSYVMHLSSQMDNEVHKVPLYDKEKDVFNIRQQNERILKQVISNKHSHQTEFNKVAQDNRFMQFRSSPLLPNSQKLILQSNSSLSPVIKKNRASNNSLHLSSINKTIGQESEDRNSPDPLDCPSATSIIVPVKVRTDRPNSLLEGLEELYQGDLKKRAQERDRPKSLALDKLGAKNIIKKRNKDLNVGNYKHYFHDDILMKKLEDPYAKNLPFEKPVVGSFRQNVIRELQAIETKAEVLRNIKMIDESIARDASVNGALAQIQENYEEDGEKVVQKQKAKGKKNKANLNMWAKHMAANSKAKVSNNGSLTKIA